MNLVEYTPDVERSFNFVKPTEKQLEIMQKYREICKKAASFLCENSQPSREQAAAIVRLEEAMFWGNAGISRNP